MQLTVATRFDFISSQPYLAAPPGSDARLDKIRAILFAPDDAPPPTGPIDWLARQADSVGHIRHSDDLMALSLRWPPRVDLFNARSRPPIALRPRQRLHDSSYTASAPSS